MYFEILGDISQIETIATASGIREVARLRKTHGRGRWRKCKGFARVRFGDGTSCLAEGTLVRSFRDRPQGIQDQGITLMTATKSMSKQLVVCISNDDYPVALETRKIYVPLRDVAAEKFGLVRVVDESGEDYLYPKTLFRPIDLPQPAKKAVLAA